MKCVFVYKIRTALLFSSSVIGLIKRTHTHATAAIGYHSALRGSMLLFDNFFDRMQDF